MAIAPQRCRHQPAETSTSRLLGVFVLLSFQFRSYIEPVVVMIAIPLGLVGAVSGHLLMGLDLSMPSMVGMASLAGIVVNNSILLVFFIRMRRRAGETVTTAAAGAARQRFRAIVLTTMTTVAGIGSRMSTVSRTIPPSQGQPP